MKRLIATAVMLMAWNGYAYKEEVHREMARRAFVAAATQNDFLWRLGVTLSTRVAGEFPEVYVGEGAFDEDHPSYRPLNHFLDPAHRRRALEQRIGLFFTCDELGLPADQWALEGSLLNGWALPDSREYLKRAIAGPNPGVRDSSMRDFFRSLGHMTHLIQDMAQPEHTRNDQHLIGSLVGVPGHRFTSGSLYEEWTAENLVRIPLSDVDSYFTGYPVVHLHAYRDYFWGGWGMADFSNAGFVTQDTNYDDERNPLNCETYTQPLIGNAVPRRQVVGERVLNTDGGYDTVTAVEYVYTSRPYDVYKQESLTDIYHTFLSSVNLETRLYNPNADPDQGQGYYSLAPSSYQTRAQMLVPMAVGYSAGFIDHYFRGRIGAEWTRNSNNGWDLTIQNQSDAPVGRDAHLTVVYRADPAYFGRQNSDDTASIVDANLSDLVPGFEGMAPGASITLQNVPIPDLLPGDKITDFERRLYVQGTLGNEAGAVIPLVQPGRQPARLKIVFAYHMHEATYGLPFVMEGLGGATLYTAYWYPPYCRPGASGEICVTQPPTSDRDSSAIFTFERVEPSVTYLFGFWGDTDTIADATVTIHVDGVEVRTITQTVDLHYTGAIHFVGQYP